MTSRDQAIVASFRAGEPATAIAAEHGISRERVRQVLMAHVPGEVMERRAARRIAGARARACPRCGGEKSWQATTCADCQADHDAETERRRTRWTREAVIAAIQEWARRHGGPPAARDWSPAQARADGRPDLAERFLADGCWPYVNTVRDRFGSWNAAITAAGFKPRRVGDRRPPEQQP